MEKSRGTSNAPMVLGIVGGVLGIPGSLCSGVCAAGITASGEVGEFYLYIGLIGSVLGLVFGILSKKMPIASGIGMLVATAFVCLTLLTFSFLNMVTVILFLIGAILSFVQKKETVE